MCLKNSQLVAEQRLKDGDVQAATKFYNLSEVWRQSFLIKFAMFLS